MAQFLLTVALVALVSALACSPHDQICSISRKTRGRFG